VQKNKAPEDFASSIGCVATRCTGKAKQRIDPVLMKFALDA
jgi:hypothetical protein